MLSTRPLRLLACAFAWLVPALADDNDAVIQARPQVPQYAEDNSLQLTLMTSGKASPQEYTVTPLTPNLGLNGSQTATKSIKIVGTLRAANADTYNRITGEDDIAYLSCDSGQGFVTPERILHSLMATKPNPIKAILLYSLSGNWCELLSENEPSYTSIMSMADAGEAGKALSFLKDSDRGEMITARIVGDLQDRSTETGGTMDGAGAGSGDGTRGHSSIAMSVLYSITGVITLLFIVIIVTGAIRAHRNPGRYGPRHGRGGAAGQSRAKGLARAVLEGLPIVKFGDPVAEAKANRDVEMDAAASEGRETRRSSAARDPEARDTGAADATDATDAQPEETPPRNGERTMSGATLDPASDDENSTEARNSAAAPASVECSICTDDFRVGEDVRVLPCSHQFHPACVDPWLIKVSGTCPLCRLDLHPKSQSRLGSEATAVESGASGQGEGAMSETGLPPPLEIDEDQDVGAAGSSHRPRRLSRLFDLHRLQHATHEERLDAIRQIRSTEYENEASGSDDHVHPVRFSDRFRIKTRAQMPRGDEDV